jgi:TRAP-type uncharacterized transport system substrate-binding protein
MARTRIAGRTPLLVGLGLVVAAVLAAAVATAAAEAESDAGGIVIASGTRGGYYHAVARGLRAVLRSEYGIPTDVLTTGGSMENLAALADPDGLVGLALAQADALQSYLAAHPDFAERYVQVADAGTECAFLVASAKSGIRGVDDLAAPGQRRVAVGEPGSGAAVTWANMTRLRPALAATRAVEQGVIEALLEMRAPNPGPGPVLALMVQRPMAVATPLEIVLQNKADYVLVPIVPGDLAPRDRETGPSGYAYERVVVGLGRESQTSIDTLCTRALVLAARAKLSPERIDAIREAVRKSRRYIMPEGR